MNIYIEEVSFNYLFLQRGILNILRKGLLKKNTHYFYYIDASFSGRLVLNILSIFLKINLYKLSFNLSDIHDNNGELIQIKIYRHDLLEIEKGIQLELGPAHNYQNSSDQSKISPYLDKSFISGAISQDGTSFPRIMFIINVIQWHHRSNEGSLVFYLKYAMPWFSVLEKYALNRGVILTNGVHGEFTFRRFLINSIKSYPRLIILLKFLKLFKFHQLFTEINKLNKDFKKKRSTSNYNLYLYPKGDINFNLDGHNSDFFWMIMSEFPANKIVYEYINDKEKRLLKKNHIIATNGIFPVTAMTSNVQLKYARDIKEGQIKEGKTIQSYEYRYHIEKLYWYSKFKANQIKIHLTWYKFNSEHMSIAAAIKDYGGIAAIWQMSFSGFPSFDGRTNTDIVFGFSDFSAQLEKENGSKISYHVATGLLNDYAGPLLKNQAQQIRKNLESAGAEKIVCVLDENSTNDSRWHTGHLLQQENYSFILEKVLETPWLGVVFKPKVAKTLRSRLGDVNDLLCAAEKTGRCFVFEETGRGNFTSAPPLLLGLASDVCIHGHFFSGTAGLECALQGLPTLLVDREGTPFSKLNELPEGKVVFKNWPETIEAVMDHFQTPSGIPGFGDWSNIIQELDPFRDGHAARRMGTYLHRLIQGFDQGLDRETVMADAAEMYIQEWGADKIIEIGEH